MSSLREKWRVVAGWCRSHAETLEEPEREEWNRFAAFLELLADPQV